MSGQPPSEPERALDRIFELVVLLGEDMTRALARDDLTVARATLLWELRGRGPSTQRALADGLKVSARNVTGLVDALVATGFVVRRPHPTDRRATLVDLTEQGSRAVAAMEQGKRELAAVLFADMPAGRLACLEEGLDDVLDRLRERLPAAEEAGR